MQEPISSAQVQYQEVGEGPDREPEAPELLTIISSEIVMVGVEDRRVVIHAYDAETATETWIALNVVEAKALRKQLKHYIQTVLEEFE